MNNKISVLQFSGYIVIGIILSILVFFSVSFLCYLMDLDTFTVYAKNGDFSIDIGFPYTYYEEKFMSSNKYPSTSANLGKLLIDCILTWLLVVAPYVMIKVRQFRKTEDLNESGIIDQREI